MNNAQAQSAAKQILNVAAGFAAEHGWKASGTFLNSTTVVSLVAMGLIWLYSHFFQHTDENEATPTPLPDSKGGGTLPPVSLFIVGLGASLLLCSCAGDAKRLELGGAYAPSTPLVSTNDAGEVSTNMVAASPADFKLYAADASFDLAYNTMEAAFKTERDNRALLWKVSPKIKKSLDAIRPQAASAVRGYAMARAVYKANPIPDNETALNTAVAVIKNLADDAVAVTATVTLNY